MDGAQPSRSADQRVVAVAAADALGRGEVVVPRQRDAGDPLDDVDEFVDRDQLLGADVERLPDVAGGEPQRAVHAVVDVGEAARLLAVAPDLDLVVAAQDRRGDLAADGGRRLLAAAVLGALGPVDVVVAGDAGLETEVLVEVPRHALAEELLPAVAVLGHRGVGVGLAQRLDLG